MTASFDEAADPRELAEWERLIPPVKGTLPGGAPLRRTDPSGPQSAKVVLLGLYPALTDKALLDVSGTRMWLPTEVERHSFAPGSASGAEIDQHYLKPLVLTRDAVRMFDVLPYYLANTSIASSGRSMADNVAAYEAATGTKTGIEARPEPAALLRLARAMPGNIARIRHYLHQSAPRLLLTLGVEAAAFVRDIDFGEAQRNAEGLLYTEAESLEVFGVRTRVVHLAHPHLFIKRKERWTKRHGEWCERVGRELVRSASTVHRDTEATS